MNEQKAALINSGVSPIADPEISHYFAMKKLDLKATTDPQIAFEHAELIIIATPTNYYGKLYFLWEHILWGAIMTFWYNTACFKVIGHLTHQLSGWIFYELILVCIAIGIAINVNHNRNGISVFIDLLIPFDIYTLLAYGRYMKKTTGILFLVLAMDERMDILQTVANIERNYLGLPFELNIEAGPLEQNVLAQYDHSRHRLLIDINTILDTSGEEMLDSVCHEAYRAYQEAQVEAYQQGMTI